MNNKSLFISLAEASKLCDYSQEYLSLRARQGKLKAVKFGRNWVTTREWLEDYIKSNNGKKGVIRNINRERNRENSKERATMERNELVFSGHSLSFKPLVILALVLIFLFSVSPFKSGPFLSDRGISRDFSLKIKNYSGKDFSYSFLSHLPQNISSDNHLNLFVLFPETASSINGISLNLTPSRWNKSIKNFVVNYLRLNSWLEKKLYVFLEKTKTKLSFFAKEKTVSENKKPKSNVSIPQTGESGMVVVPLGQEDGLKKEKIKERIKKSFSDEVIVKPEGTGDTGIIKPVFKEGVGEDYLYILVPLVKNK